MGMHWLSSYPALLLVAAVYEPLPRVVLGILQESGFDDPETEQGFNLQDLQEVRTCLRLTSVPPELKTALAVSTPPPAPKQRSCFDVAVVFQRHGSRRCFVGDAASGAVYGDTHPGQLLPQGAYELRVAGIEMRRYLMDALGLSPSQRLRPDSPAASSKAVFKKTLGLDLSDECEGAQVSPPRCTLPNLVVSLAGLIPAGAVYARSSALPRTQWSALMFLEGFYGLPFNCVGTMGELNKTTGGHAKDVCLQRTVCEDLNKELGGHYRRRKVCTSLRLPCVHSPPIEEDALMCGLMLSRRAYADANTYYRSKGVDRDHEVRDPRARQALQIAAKVLVGDAVAAPPPWVIGDAVFSERAAGSARPLERMATWVEEEKRRCEDPAAACDPGQVPTYESLVDDILTALKESLDAEYADGHFSRFLVSPAVGLQNALFRVKAFGRNEDVKHLQEILHLVGGFEGLKQEAAVEKLKMLLISYHDFILLGLIELLNLQHNEVLPYAARLTIELSHLDAESALRGSQAPAGDHGKERTHAHRADGDEGQEGAAPDEQLSWPVTPHVVRVLSGKPGGVLQPIRLPWCDNAAACPLHRWLAYTYRRLKGHWFYDIASDFRRKRIEAHSGAVRGSESS